MQREALRETLLSQHQHLRKLIAELRTRAEEVRGGRGSPDVIALRLQLAQLHDETARHVAYEDAMLRPFLSTVDAWGPERAAALEREHVAEHAALLQALYAASREDTPEHLVRTALEAADELTAHMTVEERTVVNADVLNDTCISTGQATG